MTNTSGCCYGL